MPIINSKTNVVVKNYTVDEVKEIANLVRGWIMIALTTAGSGHTGGSLSIVDIACVLYFIKAKHDPENPSWDDRDRIIWSAGHKAPALYAILGMCKYYPIEDVVKLRRLFSEYEGHPNRLKLPGVELSSGSLGHGLGIAVGCALRAKLDKKSYRVYCIMGDGEQDEGSIWESAMSAAHYSLDNLCGIIDRNKLQIDGYTKDVMNIEPLEEKYRSFGWHVITIDGHNLVEILNAFNEAETIKNKPTVIIANTIKGKGVSYAEKNPIHYHGIAPKNGRAGEESLDRAIQDLGLTHVFTKERIDGLLKIANDYQKEVDAKLSSLLPKFKKEYWWNSSDKMKVKMEAIRDGLGKALDKIGENEKITVSSADLTESVRLNLFYKNHPERRNRFFSFGIAEANMTLVTSGLAKEGKIGILGSYGLFSTGRNWEQVRTTVCYNNFNVKIVAGHSGVFVGQDGATHQSLEDISNMYYLPNMRIVVPCDSIEAFKAMEFIVSISGPCAIRTNRDPVPIVTKSDTPFRFGVANIFRFRKEVENFIDAFDIYLATDYKSENEDLTIVACGYMVAESMRAAWILKEEFGIETRVVNMHTIKPMDKETIMKAVEETGVILTVEDHQLGGFGNIVAGFAVRLKKYKTPIIMDMIGVNDRFGESGKPWELLIAHGLTAEFIAEKAKKLYEVKSKH